MILVPDTEHELDRLARDVADAALKLDRERRDGCRPAWTVAGVHFDADPSVDRTEWELGKALRAYEAAKQEQRA